MQNKTAEISSVKQSAFSLKAKAFAELFKLRLSFLVVFSAILGYLIVASTPQFGHMLLLALGGFLVTGASNTINQIIERDVDPLMDRTKNRPLPTGRVSISEAIILSGVSGVAGLGLLSYFFNPTAGVLAAIALISYAFIYTPLKKVSPIAVFVGAIPGALPPLIGAAAFNGEIPYVAWLLFAIQFVWQFPHFWSIAWVAYDDYLKADIMLLPSAQGKGKASALYNLIYTLALIPFGVLPFVMGEMGWFGLVVLLISGVGFSVLSLRLFKHCNDKAAKQVMFGSFLYLPLSLFAFYFDKFLF